MYNKPDEIKSFRWWCCKVLPLVYDDSLSYYELLCKVMKKLNELIEIMNEFDLSELYALVKSIMDMVGGDAYSFDDHGTFRPDFVYEPQNYVIYDNKMYKCIKTTAAHEFDPTCWVEVSVGKELTSIFRNICPYFAYQDFTYYKGQLVFKQNEETGISVLFRANKDTTALTFIDDDWDVISINDITYEYYNYKRNMYWGSFKSFDNQLQPYSEWIEGTSAEREFKEYDINNVSEYNWDSFMSDCNLFPINSVMTGIEAHSSISNIPPLDRVFFNVITIGNACGTDIAPLPDSFNELFYVHDYTLQIAIPIRNVIDGGDPENYDNRIMYRTRISDGDNNSWTNWKTLNNSVTPTDNLDAVIGSTANTYDNTHTYYTGDFCTYDDGTGVKMYKALDTTTASFDSTKWSVTNIINELGSTIIREPATTFSQVMGAIGSEVTP